jgi:hypothetical protein
MGAIFPFLGKIHFTPQSFFFGEETERGYNGAREWQATSVRRRCRGKGVAEFFFEGRG